MILAALALATTAAAMASVELPLYMGAWREVAAFPNMLQKGCADTFNVYRLSGDGTIETTTGCWKKGRLKRYQGRARVLDPGVNRRWKVRFAFLFGTGYKILDLDERYRFAAVGTPNKRQLWFIAREPRLLPADYARLTAAAARAGYDVSRLVPTIIEGRAPPSP